MKPTYQRGEVYWTQLDPIGLSAKARTERRSKVTFA